MISLNEQKLEKQMRKTVLMLALALVAACAPGSTKPVVQYASKNSIAIRYKPHDLLNQWLQKSTGTPEAIKIAIQHCKKYNKVIKLLSSNAKNILTNAEKIDANLSGQNLLLFMCTYTSFDKRI